MAPMVLGPDSFLSWLPLPSLQSFRAKALCTSVVEVSGPVSLINNLVIVFTCLR